MARVGRLAGALLARTENCFYLVGNLKEPCDFVAEGFEPPCEEVDATQRPYIRLLPTRLVDIVAPCITVEVEGEALPQALARRLLIQRNGSVSERLWHLLDTQTHCGPPARPVDARWLTEMPEAIWDIVRDTVLRCA